VSIPLRSDSVLPQVASEEVEAVASLQHLPQVVPMMSGEATLASRVPGNCRQQHRPELQDLSKASFL